MSDKHSFLRKWFEGLTKVGRVLATPKRFYVRTFLEFLRHLECCGNGLNPFYMSVNPFTSDKNLYGLERLFFDFDCKEDFNLALKDALKLADRILSYEANALLCFSGQKGYHCYVFLPIVSKVESFNVEDLKLLQRIMSLKLLGCSSEATARLKYPTLEVGIISDVMTVSRFRFLS